MSSENTFGQNSWLVDEMFQQYKDDPNSVDAEWRELFESKGAPKTAKGTSTVTPPAAFWMSGTENELAFSTVAFQSMTAA